MDEKKAKELKEQFESCRYRYQRLAYLVRRFLVGKATTALRRSGRPFLHDHKDRAKDPGSLYRNLIADRYDQAPESLSEIKDLAGARLIFHFRDDLDRFWDVPAVGRWFGKLAFNTARKALDPTSDAEGRELFGYDSYHFTCEVSENTEFWAALNVGDKANLRGRRCEVQLRTILQHAWAEAEHALRYKVQKLQQVDFPPRQQRKWGLLAAILEGADLTLVERKEYYENLPPRKEAPVIAGWVYSNPEHGALVGGVRYEYQILHAAGDGSSVSTPVIKRDREIFDLDLAMGEAGGPADYKQQMWAVLREKEPDFIMTSFTHDSTVVRAKDWDGSTATLTVQPAQYSDQMVTNHKRALKQDVPNCAPLKVNDFAGRVPHEFRSFAESPMSNTIGIAGMVRTTDAKWVIGLRSPKVAFDPGRWGCSTSGALEWAEPENWSGRDLETWMKEALARECEEELGFHPSSTNIYYLAFAREFGRAGKPQFFFLIEAPMQWSDVETAWQVYASDERELSDIRAVNEGHASELVGTEAKKVTEIISGAPLTEELRMNLALALKYHVKSG